MSNTTEKCREIVLRLAKAIDLIEVNKTTHKDKNRKTEEPLVSSNTKNTPDHRSSSAYNLLFQTLIEIRTKSYTKNQGTRARLIHYNIIKKIFYLLCEKPDDLQVAYDTYLSKGRKKGDERLLNAGKEEGVRDGIHSKAEPSCSSSSSVKDEENAGKFCPRSSELDEQQKDQFMDFRDLLLSLLGDFCLDSAARSQVIKYNGIAVLRTILFETESSSIWRRCCRTLANIAVDPACQKAIQATDITAKIIYILENSCDSECQSTICRTLRLFANSSQLHKTIIESNGISVLVKVAKYGTQSVTGAAVKTLAELGKKNCSAEFAQQVLRGECLAKLVEMTSEDSVSSESALCVLLYLSKHSFMRPLMGSSNVIQTMQSKFESKIPSSLYTEILNAFCLFSNEALNRVKLRQSGILKILLDALQDVNYATLHNRIISAFVNFLYDDSSFDLLLEYGLVPVLFVHLQRCAGFSFTMPKTEPLVESLIEAVMNSEDDRRESALQKAECSDSWNDCSADELSSNMKVDKRSNSRADLEGELIDKGDNSGNCEGIVYKKNAATLLNQDLISETDEGHDSSNCRTVLNNSSELGTNINVDAVDKKDKNQPLMGHDNSCCKDNETSSMKKDTALHMGKVQKPCPTNSAGLEEPSGISRMTRRIPKRKPETEFFPNSSKRYRLSIGVETDLLNEPAILNLRVPNTQHLNQLGVETLANMVNMPVSSVMSNVSSFSTPSESSERCTSEIVAFHDNSLLEVSELDSANTDDGKVDVFVSLRTRCSLGRIEEILKMKGFFIQSESDTFEAENEIDIDDDADDDDDTVLENEKMEHELLVNSYANSPESQSFSLSKDIPSTSGQHLSPLSNTSYYSPDWTPCFNIHEDDFSSEDSYSSVEEIQAESVKADTECDRKVTENANHQETVTDIVCDKKPTNSDASIKHSKTNRTTEDNILILLSHISQKENPMKYLANVESFLCLLRYIGQVPLAFPRSVRILGRVVSNPFCLESLLAFMAPALIFLELMTSWNQQICDARCRSDMFWTPSRATWLNIGNAFSINSCINGSDDLLKAGQLILNEFGVVSEINYGMRLLVQHLMKETPQQKYVIACLPFLCRSHNVQEKLLMKFKGFDLLKNIVLSNPKSCLSKVVILGLSYLACHLNIKSDPISPTPYPKCSKMKKSPKCCLKGFRKDITFVTDYGQKVFANREQLTRQSEVFAAMLTSNFLESTSAEVPIPDISLVALRFIVHYLHGCSAKCKVIEFIVSPKSDLPFDGIVNVLAHADQYMLTELQGFLVKIVREKYLNYTTAGKFYNVASLHNYADLRKECLTYCLVNLVFGSKSVSCMMDIVTGPYAIEFLDLVKTTIKSHATIDHFPKI